jgi:mercuric ion binding protein
MSRPLNLAMTVAAMAVVMIATGCQRGAAKSQESTGQSTAAPGSQPGAAPATQAKTVERAFSVEGMHCGTCPITVRTAAEGVKGVKKARVSMEQARAWVTFDAATTDPGTIAAAITKSGYPARPLPAAKSQPTVK